MPLLSRTAPLALAAAAFASAAMAQQFQDIAVFVKAVFHDEIDKVKKGIYCRALECEFEIQSFSVAPTEAKTYALTSVGWLQGTIPGLKGSAKRTLILTATYTRGTCIVKDVTPISDVTESNNGWGASRIVSAFKGIAIPRFVIMTPQDCNKVEDFLANPPAQ